MTFCSGVGTVTGANFLLETADRADGTKGSKILIDCGLIQGKRVAEAANSEAFPYDVSQIDALVITHAHMDHVGRIPKLVKEGFKGPIYSTPETKSLTELVLNDAAGILAMEAKQEGIEPLYDLADVQRVSPLWKTVKYHEELKLTDDVSIFLKDAGHILGSAMVEVTVGVAYSPETRLRSEQSWSHPERLARVISRTVVAEKRFSGRSNQVKILFTGDLGNSPAPLLRDTEEIGDADYLVMESVYGDRNHEDPEERADKFKEIIESALARGGTLIIPAFSIDRTQVLLYELNNMVEQGMIPSVPIFVDSPMAIKATEIYRASADLFNYAAQARIARGDDPFEFPRLAYTMSAGESRDIERVKSAKIIIAGSGMSVGGRVIGHEERYLSDERSTILLVGYQTAGSLGRQLTDGVKKVRIHGRTIHVKARIETFYGYSAHKDSDHLVDFVSTATEKLKKVFVTMGEPKASMHLAQRLNSELNVKAVMPEIGKEYLVS